MEQTTYYVNSGEVAVVDSSALARKAEEERIGGEAPAVIHKAAQRERRSIGLAHRACRERALFVACDNEALALSARPHARRWGIASLSVL